jgi:ribosomal-protein-alanine N-acetyltransferase
MLNWDGDQRPARKLQSGVKIRPMTNMDLGAVYQIDFAAFEPLWQNSQESLEIAFQQSILASVAEIGERLVGYQISTPTPVGGHLARLAVIPECQQQGIGYGLLDDLLNKFEGRSVQRVTVNTQHRNLASLALYQKAGFRLAGEAYPILELA